MNIPVVLIVYKRTETTRRVFEVIRKVRPSKFYLVADGPKNISQKKICDEVVRIVEKGIDWECDLIKIESAFNLGLARRVQTGLDEVFSMEKHAIILEDDTLPDPSFFKFCEELLNKYKNNERVAHISGCNLYPEVFKGNSSYCFSSIINIWGWATWARAWKHFDLQMPSWEKEHKNQFLQNWCKSRYRETQKQTRKMFDLHCKNDDPWAWSYQWIYNCWHLNGLSVIPSKNLVANIGFGRDATNTKSPTPIDLFPAQLQSMNFPLLHPAFEQNLAFEKRYSQMERLPMSRKLKTRLSSLLRIVKSLNKH
jgi:hypothetical protein